MNDHDGLFKFPAYEIHRLIGADVAGNLHIGNIKQLQSGLILKETLLEWTLMRKSDKIKVSDSTKGIISLHANDVKVFDLGHPNTHEIFEPREKNNTKGLEMAAEEHFD